MYHGAELQAQQRDMGSLEKAMYLRCSPTVEYSPGSNAHYNQAVEKFLQPGSTYLLEMDRIQITNRAQAWTNDS